MAVSPSGRELRIVEVQRDEAAWTEEPVSVDTAAWSYPRSLGFGDAALVRATRVHPIEYTWRLGRVETLGRPDRPSERAATSG